MNIKRDSKNNTDLRKVLLITLLFPPVGLFLLIKYYFSKDKRKE
tara:strand:+ start:646 stop:777 length:132 start_codon:yes stop_codon:yes gene_type:complete